MYCEKCQSGVHVECYGNPLVQRIPEGDWTCQRCKAGASSEVNAYTFLTRTSLIICYFPEMCFVPDDRGPHEEDDGFFFLILFFAKTNVSL